MLTFLLRRAGQVLSKDEILAGVWEYDFDGDPNIVEVYVGRLRRKVDEPFGQQSIETVRGAGYRAFGAVSIRWRVTLLATVAALVILLLTGAVVVKAHERLLVDGLDERLQQLADAYLADAEGEDASLSLPGDEDSVAQLVRGETVIDVASVATGDARDRLDNPVADPPPGRADASPAPSPTCCWVRGSYRVLSVDLGDGTVLHVAVNLDDVRDSTSALLRVLVVAVPLAAVVLGALIWWFVGRTLRPVEAMRAQVSAVGGARPAPSGTGPPGR